MSDETPGVGQTALPPKEGQAGLRTLAERPVPTGQTVRLAQMVAGQYVLTSQPHGIPSLTQITPGSLPGNANLAQGGMTRIISISPSRVGQTSPLRPSLANQSIVNVLTKPRTNSNIRLQLFPSSEQQAVATHSRALKRPLSSANAEKKDAYAAKLQRVINHRIVRSKLVKEKYNEHLLEAFYLETGNSILDLYQFAKRPKTQAYLAYLKEHAIDPRDYQDETPNVVVPQTTPSTPSATSVNSLPGISSASTTSTSSTTDSTVSGPKSVSVKSTSRPASNNQEMIVEKAKQEAYVVQRIADLQKDGLWSEKRLPKVQEMPRTKAHWDFLLEEMVWLAADFAQERKWKKAAAKKCARMVQKYFQDKALAAQRAEKAQEQNLRRLAAFCAKEIKNFWNNVEKLVEYKQNTILEEKRKKALDQQLSFIVDQTEKYSQLLAEGMNKTVEQPASAISSRSVSRAHSDTEFDPDLQSDEDEDDEETIAQEEAALGTEGHSEEVEALQKESQMELEDLLEDDFLKDYLLNRDTIRLSESEESDDEHDKKSKSKDKDDDDESKAMSDNSESSKEDVEDEESEDEVEEETKTSDSASQEGHDELKMLVEDSHKEGEETKTDKNDDLINDAAAIAESIQPKGNTLSSTNVSTNIPFLLKYILREYQHIGLDWLVTMFERKLNGILADEMGLGKTIQTIALLAHLACEKENWGPHLIVVPTSVMLNWEMECKKWCPAFKILTYYGSQKERKMKRTGWTKPNAFHICITSYKLVIQDHQSFRRKKWKYLILDEAQNIKNFKSQRWQMLLNFQTQQRLLLTGTPLQNNLMELWSLMHFLMPNVFHSHREFKEWFSNPVTGMIEGNSEYNENIIKRLHKVLRPFLLRRLKSEVEKQMPKKFEHVVMCRLSKRQRYLYDDYMSRAKTRETLASGNLLSVINVLMQLRKVCNHPNLFEVRPTTSPFQCDGIRLHIPSIVYGAVDYDPEKHVNLHALNLLLIMQEIHLSSYQCYRMRQSRMSKKIIELDQVPEGPPPCPPAKLAMRVIPDKAPVDLKAEKREQQIIVPPPLQLKNIIPQNVKMKVSGVQLVNPQGIVKTIPMVNISQAVSGQIGTPVNVTSVLKPADKISASFAQLVQTSTGKHVLFTSNPNITASVPVTTTPGGQKLTILSKQPVSAIGNAGHTVAKALVKFQLATVPAVVTTASIPTTNSAAVTSAKSDDKGAILQVGHDYIDRLYSNQNSLDVRWKNDKEVIGLPGEEDPKGERRRRLELMGRVNEQRCSALPLYGRDFQEMVKVFKPSKHNSWVGGTIHCLNTLFGKFEDTTSVLKDMLFSPERRINQLKDICDRFIFYVPAVKTSEPDLQVWHPAPSKYWGEREDKNLIQRLFSKPATSLHHIASAMVTQFPDPRLIQYDCGKLQTLDKLLRKLKIGGHRVLIFTQMTKMLDILEAFLNFHGHIYLRLDGTTRVDQRQVLMERFNGDPRIFVFILSTRSGGVGVNLTGADTVIFYDSDWNPTMDAQAQDRCHRIGQTRDVHIYRLVSERTIEENILKKANQKRLLGDLAIEGGNFTTAYFKSSTIQDLFNIDQTEESAAARMAEVIESKKKQEELQAASGEASSSTSPGASDDKAAIGALENALAACEDDQDVQAARTAKAEAVADLAEFDENIPLDEPEKEPEISKAEQEINNIIEKLSPIEKYAMHFIETTESAWSAEQLAAAEREIEEQKREWEQNRLAAMREEEERRARELEEEGDIITFSRTDATNQVSSKTKKFLNRSKKVLNRSKDRLNKRIVRKRKTLELKRKKGKLKQKKLTVTKSEDTDTDFVPDESQESQQTESTQINGDTEENSLSSTDLDYNSTLTHIRNHVDYKSPRSTRSRGTVAINLWTLDVSPILPGEKPFRKRPKSSLSGEETSDSEHEEEKHNHRRRNKLNKFKREHAIKDCSVSLSDILLDSRYKFFDLSCSLTNCDTSVDNSTLSQMTNDSIEDKSENDVTPHEDSTEHLGSLPDIPAEHETVYLELPKKKIISFSEYKSRLEHTPVKEQETELEDSAMKNVEVVAQNLTSESEITNERTNRKLVYEKYIRNRKNVKESSATNLTLYQTGSIAEYQGKITNIENPQLNTVSHTNVSDALECKTKSTEIPVPAKSECKTTQDPRVSKSKFAVTSGSQNTFSNFSILESKARKVKKSRWDSGSSDSLLHSDLPSSNLPRDYHNYADATVTSAEQSEDFHMNQGTINQQEDFNINQSTTNPHEDFHINRDVINQREDFQINQGTINQNEDFHVNRGTINQREDFQRNRGAMNRHDQDLPRNRATINQDEGFHINQSTSIQHETFQRHRDTIKQDEDFYINQSTSISHDDFQRNRGTINQHEDFQRNRSNINQHKDFPRKHFHRNRGTINQHEDFQRHRDTINENEDFQRNPGTINPHEDFHRNRGTISQHEDFQRNRDTINQDEDFRINRSTSIQHEDSQRNRGTVSQHEDFQSNCDTINEDEDFRINQSTLIQPEESPRNRDNINQDEDFRVNRSTLILHEDSQRNRGNISQHEDFPRNRDTINQDEDFRVNRSTLIQHEDSQRTRGNISQHEDFQRNRGTINQQEDFHRNRGTINQHEDFHVNRETVKPLEDFHVNRETPRENFRTNRVENISSHMDNGLDNFQNQRMPYRNFLQQHPRPQPPPPRFRSPGHRPPFRQRFKKERNQQDLGFWVRMTPNTNFNPRKPGNPSGEPYRGPKDGYSNS